METSFGVSGCSHYQRGCQLRCDDCRKFFTCRFCHNEHYAEIAPAEKYHELVRSRVQELRCLSCSYVQGVAEACENCGQAFGNYCCLRCRLFDFDTSKGQFHCEECGLCRQGGRENFFHCKTCGCCIATALKENHKCIENAI